HRERGETTVDAPREPAARRGAVAQRVEQEAEPRLGLLGTDPEQLEYALLDVEAIDADRAAANLRAVEHEVVGARAEVTGIVEVALGGGEWMVRGVPALLLGVPEEGGELDH